MRWIQTTRWLREYVDIDGVSTSLDDTDTRLNKDEHKTVLIEDPNNHLLHQLLSSSTPHELLSHVANLGSACPLPYAAQAIVSTWDLKKLTPADYDFDSSVLESEEFQDLLGRVDHHHASLSDASLTAVLVSLKRLLQDPKVPAYHTLVVEAASRCSNFNFQDLSRFLVSLDQSNNVNLTYQSHAIHRLQQLLPSCHSEDDLKCAAISLSRLLRIASPSLIKAFCEKTSEILTPASKFHTFLRCLPVACQEQNKSGNMTYTVNILSLINPVVPTLNDHDLGSLTDIIISGVECNATATLKLIQERAQVLSKTSMTVSTARSLCLGLPLPHKEMERISFFLVSLLDSNLDERSLMRVMDVLLWLPIMDKKVLSLFWNRINSLVRTGGSRNFPSFLKGYMSCFQQTRFRNAPFEALSKEWSLNKVNSDNFILPYVSLAMLFLLVMDTKSLIAQRMDRLVSLLGQFSVKSLFELALGLKLTEGVRQGRLPRILSPNLMALKVEVHNEMRRRVNTVTTLPQLTLLSSGSRLLWFSSGHYEDFKDGLATRCKDLLVDGSPRAVARMCRTLTSERLWMPETLEALVTRATSNPEVLFPVTLCHLAYVSFVTGYVPTKLDQMSHLVNDSILR